MPRRKKIRPDPVAGGRRAANKAQFDGTERNRASPQAICKLYKHINGNQRVAIIDMGTGPFLDIKCGYLHNTVVTWFTRLYHSGRRGFVVPGRGFIPLTEESVHQMLGIPHGDIEVKYEADYEKEDDIAGSLFPVDGNRPKITTVATAIINYNEAEDRFKQLWLIYIISTVLAPTTDTRISNKCYPMLENINQANRLNLCKFVVDQLHEHLSKGKYTKGCLLYCMLRYLDALDCDGMELELPDTPYRVNAWSKTQVDVVAELDMLEHDPPSYGKFQIMFPVIEEIGVSEVSGHHWYLLCINNTAQRFEALDSLRGKTNMGLIGHATAVMKRIKEAWKLYYHKSRVQIEDYKLEIIDVPKQRPNSVHCGFYMLESVEKWDGENVPQIRKEDIAKIKKVAANKWLSAPFNQNKKWKWQLDQNSF